MKYDPQSIESKWQKRWEVDKTFATPSDVTPENKFYILPQLPYPSGSGLHVGHAEVYTACDIYARYQRMVGKKVLQVFGLDSFGLPAENYAIKTNVHPKKTIDETGAMFVSQVKSLGVSVDWDRFVRSSDPDYYKWTQWFFLLMYQRGLAYRKNQSVNWCDSCKTVLANEQVVDGHCERCDTEVNQRDMEQWYLKITEYADRLEKDLDNVDWPEETKRRQRNWIGRSEGANFTMKVKGKDFSYQVYDSVPQTYTAQTFAVIAPEHADLPTLMAGEEKEKEVLDFAATIKKKKMEGNKFVVEQETEGVFTGLYMDDPYGTGDIPLWVASYAIAEYGSGVVGCSAHDERDFEFAKKYDIPLRPVMFPADKAEAKKVKNLEYCYHHDPEGVLQSPKEFKGRKWGEAREDIIDFVVEKGMATRAVQYKLRDWSISRQRFWGAPIPMLFNADGTQEEWDKWFSEKPEKVVHVHAWGANPDSHFRGWLREKESETGIESVTPALPNTDYPDRAEWLEHVRKELEGDSLGTVLEGRSLGTWTALEAAQHHRLRKLILVAPTLPTDEWYKQIDSVVEDKKAVKLLTHFVSGALDFEAIRKNVGEIVVYLSTDDPYIPLEVSEKYISEHFPEARIIRMRDAGHFSADSGYADFPGLFEEIIREVRPNVRPLPEADLPVILPDDVDFKPTGESPLNYSKDFQKGVEKKYGKGWKREPDTLDTFMCSSWYYFRYLDPTNDGAFASPESLKQWMPVDFYLGGEEHVNGHLLYSRFFTKVLYDAGYIDFDEPFATNRHQGLILGEDNRKMSKRWGNVINPTDVVNEFGADTCRMYEMFMGPLEDTKPWSTNGVKGVRRFLDKVWRLHEKVDDTKAPKELDTMVHKTIKKVGDDLAKLKFNTAIAKLMELSNAFMKQESISKEHFAIFVKLLSPFAPHMAEELWEALGNKTLVSVESWPVYDKKKIVDEMMTLVVQVNGKVRASIEVSADIAEADAKEHALAHDNVVKWLDGNKPKKVIYVKGKLVSIVV